MVLVNSVVDKTTTNPVENANPESVKSSSTIWSIVVVSWTFLGAINIEPVPVPSAGSVVVLNNWR